MNNETNSIYVDSITETAVTKILSDLFSTIAYLDPGSVRHNIEMASEGGLPKVDRSIRVETANYFINHFSLIYVGLLANNDFREMFKEAVSVEIALDERDDEFVKEMRANMQGKKQKPSRGSFVLNFGKYNDSVFTKFNKRLLDSFKMLDGFDDAINDLAADLTDDDMLVIGFCVSNFMYTVRALSKNHRFAEYVRKVIHNVQVQLELA